VRGEKAMLEEYDALLNIQELQQILNVGRNSAYELLKSGEIPAFRIGKNWKIPKDAVIHYIGQWRNLLH